MIREGLLCACLLFGVGLSASAKADVDLAPFVDLDVLGDIKISPTGAYFAATLPMGDSTAIAVLDRADQKIIASYKLQRNNHIADFWWAKDDRLLFALAERFGARDFPNATGELYAMNVDGSRAQLLVGYRVQQTMTGTRIQTGAREERVYAWPVDMLRDDPRHILVGISPFTGDPYTRVERMDVYTGRRTMVATVPVTRADFLTDNTGEVRFALGAGGDNVSQLYYRDRRGAEWTRINHETETGRIEIPIGFSADNTVAYMRTTQASGPDALVAFDIATSERRPVLADARVDPEVLYRPGTSIPVGARFPDATRRLAFFDEASDDARLYRMLEQAFPKQDVDIASSTRDARTKLIEVSSDVDPGSIYTYDAVSRSADFVMARREKIDPDRLAPMQAVSLTARDGLALSGFLTRPPALARGPAPLVVMPHGGPFGIRDVWAFDPDVQVLAQAGYAVLQVNFRGSGGYGRAFRLAGARQWGRAMQDDLTDATRWAIAEGHADADRICIFGGSYGGYASLMGVAREPDLYRCAVGYVGVYDLQAMRGEDRRGGMWRRSWFDEWVGSDAAQLGAASPTRLAGQVRAPVLLVAGGEDEIAPVEHTRKMERALRGAGVPVEALYVDKEGHGFYKPENRRLFYTRLLDFLAPHLGGQRAAQ